MASALGRDFGTALIGDFISAYFEVSLQQSVFLLPTFTEKKRNPASPLCLIAAVGMRQHPL